MTGGLIFAGSDERKLLLHGLKLLEVERRRNGLRAEPRLVELIAALSNSVTERHETSEVDDTGGMPEAEWMSRAEVARLLRCSVRTVDRKTSSGVLPSSIVSGHRLYSRNTIERILHGS